MDLNRYRTGQYSGRGQEEVIHGGNLVIAGTWILIRYQNGYSTGTELPHGKAVWRKNQ
jgi:hypothetical protein